MATPDPLETLLSQLSNGDPEAAEQVFRVYEPILRMMVRRNLPPTLRTKFDSIDIVQSVWGDLLDGFRSGKWQFDTPEKLRAFLLRVTRNRLIDRVRSERTAIRLERRIDRAHLEGLINNSSFPADAQINADELWERMLAICPPQHRGLLDLKRQGLSLADIASQTRLHESSVRRILYELADRLAADESAANRE